MGERNDPELCDEGIDYALRKNGIRPTPELKSDLKWTMLEVIANLFAKHEVAEIDKSIARKQKAKRRMK